MIQTPRDAVLAALRHIEGPTVPYNLMLSPPAEDRLRRHYGVEDLQAELGLHLYLYGCRGKPLYAAPDRYGPTITDEFGVVWSTSTIDRGYPVSHPLTAPSLAGYDFPAADDPGRWEGVAEASARYPDQFRLAVIGDLWERAHFLRGLDGILCDAVAEPEFAHELLGRICAYNLQTLDRLTAFCPDGVFISDDYGFQDRLMLRPETWRAVVLPHLRVLLQAARQRGLVTMLHSCGNVADIIPDLIADGLDILHPIQPEAMDIAELKREYGRDITFCGGISTQQLLPFGTPQQVRDEVRRTLEIMGKGGGYIAEPGITVQADVPLENLVALVETLRGTA